MLFKYIIETLLFINLILLFTFILMLIFYPKDLIIKRLFYMLLIFSLFYVFFIPNVNEINLFIIICFYILYVWK
jgi:hypothetical protein